MINSIIQAISISLESEFGFENYMEEIKQDLKEPCFFISCLNPTTKLFLGKRYFSQNQFCIQFFPETDLKYAECNDIVERLFWCLEYITVDGSLQRGTKMRSEMADGILNFFVNYDFFQYRVEDYAVMETLKSRNRMKG